MSQFNQFASREEAARRLASELDRYRGRNPLILAIPRGAVPMGRVLADELQGDLDVVLVRKLGAPANPELAIGAVDESGWVYVADFVRELGVDERYLEQEKQTQLEVIRKRRALYTPGRASITVKDRIVIVVDDGLATGATMIAALHAARAQAPAQLICAIPVAAPDSLLRVKALADDVICLYAPHEFYAVGQFYQDFRQVEDVDVIHALRMSRAANTMEDR